MGLNHFSFVPKRYNRRRQMSLDKQGFTIRKHFFKNKLVILAQPTPLTFPSGRVGPELLMFYKRLTQVESAAILAGPASILAPRNRNFSLLRVDQPKYFEGIRALVKIMTGNGAIPGIQLTLPPPVPNPLDWYRPHNPFHLSMKQFPPVEKITQALAKSCSRCMDAGFLFIEIDMSPKSYLERLWIQEGGRTLGSLIGTCRKAAGENAILSLRVSEFTPNLQALIQTFLDQKGDLIAIGASRLPPTIDPTICIFDQSSDPNDAPPNPSGLIGIRPDQVFS